MGGDGSSPGPLLALLRGRLRLVVLLGVVFAGPLGVLGYHSADPMYKSSGELMITQSDLLYKGPLDQPTGYLKDYVASEARRIKSRAVFHKALEQPELIEAQFPMGEDGLAKLSRLIKVSPPVTGQLIAVTAEEPNRWYTTAAVNAVMLGYIQLNEEEQRARREGGIAQTDRRERAVRDRLEDLQTEGRPLLEKYGSAEALDRQLISLDTLKLELGSEHRKNEGEIERLLAEIDSRSILLNRYNAGEAVEGPPMVELTLDDPRMTELDEQRHLTATELQKALDGGQLPTHSSVLKAQRELNELELLISDRARALAERWWARLAVEVDDKRNGVTALRRQQASLENRRTEIDDQRFELTGLIQQAREISDDIESARSELAEVIRVRSGIEQQLAGESLGQARVHELAQLPPEDEISSDPRMMRAGAGALLGLMIAVGSVVLSSGLKHQLRYIDELTPERLGASCLGAVPEIRSLTANSFAEIEHCVEPMRARIEVHATRPGSRGSQVLAVTSPGPSDGKSTIARALAASFARAGHRTVLIDADPDGRATTAAFAMSGEPGFVDYLMNPDLTMIQASGKSGLWILPAGRVDERTVSSSYAAVSRMIDDLRGHFEQIVVDTGGVLGSTESSLIGRAADGMVLVVSRGKTLEMAERAIARIRDIGGSCIGVIFNRADPSDFVRTSVAVSSVRRDIGDPGVVPVLEPGQDGEMDQSRSSARA